MSVEAMKQMVNALERIDLWLKARYQVGIVGNEIEALEAGRKAISDAEKQQVQSQLDNHAAELRERYLKSAPLTDEQIEKLLDKVIADKKTKDQIGDFARAIEAAHGIL